MSITAFICQWLPTISGKSLIWCVDQWSKTRYFGNDYYLWLLYALFHIYIHRRNCDFSSKITHQIREICLLVCNQWAEMQLFINDYLRNQQIQPFRMHYNVLQRDNSPMINPPLVFLTLAGFAEASPRQPHFFAKKTYTARNPCHSMLFTWIPCEITKESLRFPALFYLDFT